VSKKTDAIHKDHYVGALEILCRALGELPANALDQASFAAYSRAVDLLDPDEFRERFLAQAKQRPSFTR
jgi:hypothetical protein